jgi:DNA modification methylase
MEKWEIATEKFLKKWKNKKEVVGAVLCGSYITGNPSKHSDLDIQILLDKQIIWRERGNKYVDGFLIEYFANPLPQNLEYYQSDYQRRKKAHIHMFLTGKILFDKNGDVKK